MIQFYLSHCQFTVQYGDAKSRLRPVHADVQQSSVLGPLLYLLYTADIPGVQNTHVVTFGDDTAILTLRDNYFSAT